VAVQAPETVATEPQITSQVVSEAITDAGACSSEIVKYDWNVEQATAVMMIESRDNPLSVNDNPRTGDYSVGCFQINLIGNMRNTRPSEEWLKIAANNVQYAYQMYTAQGTFCKTSGWYNTCKRLGYI